MVLDVDPEELAVHVDQSKGEKPPYVNEVEEWDGSDFFRAADVLIIDSGEVELVSVELVEEGVGDDV
jgi:hypothetical protein